MHRLVFRCPLAVDREHTQLQFLLLVLGQRREPETIPAHYLSGLLFSSLCDNSVYYLPDFRDGRDGFLIILGPPAKQLGQNNIMTLTFPPGFLQENLARFLTLPGGER